MRIIGLKFYKERFPFACLRLSWGHDQHKLAYTFGFQWFRTVYFVCVHCVHLKNGKVDMSHGYTSSFEWKLRKRGWI